MNQFKKESRYFVFKISKLTQEQQQRLYDFSMELGPYNSVGNCVVVESDWPNYVETWETIQAITENRYVPRDLLITRINQLQEIEDAADEAYSAWFDRNLSLEAASLSKLYSITAGFDLKMQPDLSVVLPKSVEQATLMALLGTNYLKEHAPERLKQSTESSPIQQIKSLGS